MTQLPSRAAIDQAGDLDFTWPLRSGAVPITIEIAPDGVHVTVHYTGTLASIGPTLDKIRAAGLLGLVQARPPVASQPRQTVEPLYKPDGTACCPVHKTPLTEGQYGLYCRSKAAPGEAQNAKGYCSLRFAE